jgi:hypothetical protein
MAMPIGEVVEEIRDLLNKRGQDVVTLKWPEFYKLVRRERLKTEFTVELASAMKAGSLLIAYGSAVVLIAKDYSFAPLKV